MAAAHVVVRYTVKPGLEHANADLVRAVYAELAELNPDGFGYATFRLDDGRSFVHVASTEAGHETPLSGLAAFRAFVDGIEDRCEQVPVVSEAEQIGAFGIFSLSV